MTEKSWPWSTVAGLGDGAAELGEADTREFLAAYFKVQDLTEEGVSKGVGGELEVTGVATPLSVDTGSGVSYGLYVNTTSVNLAVTTPSLGTTGGRVVLQTNWAGTGGAGLEAKTRLAVIYSSDGNPAIPALTQSFGTTWEISLATFTVTTGGVITVTDDRTFRKVTGMVGTDELEPDSVTDDKIPNLTRRLFVPVTRAWDDTGGAALQTIKDRRGFALPNAIEAIAYGADVIPNDFDSNLVVIPVGVSGANGNLAWGLEVSVAADGQHYGTTHNYTDTGNVDAVLINQIKELSSLSIVAAAIDDHITCTFTRNIASDTIGTNFFIRGFILEYTAKY